MARKIYLDERGMPMEHGDRLFVRTSLAMYIMYKELPLYDLLSGREKRDQWVTLCNTHGWDVQSMYPAPWTSGEAIEKIGNRFVNVDLKALKRVISRIRETGQIPVLIDALPGAYAR